MMTLVENLFIAGIFLGIGCLFIWVISLFESEHEETVAEKLERLAGEKFHL